MFPVMRTLWPPARHPGPLPRRVLFWGLAGAALGYVVLGGVWGNWRGSAPRAVRPAGDAMFGWMFTSVVCGGGETSAISTLRNIASCQSQFQSAASVDEDSDGAGEFGGLLEMSGKVAPRGREAPISPPVLSGAFRTLGAAGTVSRSGYLFRMFLVGHEGSGLGELQRVGFDEGEVDPDASEKQWICYAWPAQYRLAGSRTFVIDNEGDIFGTDCAAYSGPSGPKVGAALLPSPAPASTVPAPGSCCGLPPDPLGLLDAPIADGVPARDGNVWKRIH